VSNFVFLGVPNSISEETVKDTLDEVLQKLEDELIHDDKDYKLTVRQKENWIKYAITKEYPGGMPWEDQAEKKKKQQSSNNSHLVFVFHVHHPDEQRLATLLDRAKYRNLWYEHWGGVAFTVEQPDFTMPAGVKDRYIEMVQSWCNVTEHGGSNNSRYCHGNKEIRASSYSRQEWPATGANRKVPDGYFD
jgi:hypothetical protein